jgi:hypothetical protein
MSGIQRSASNPYEEAARVKKARKLADVMAKYSIDASMAERMSDIQWDHLSAAVGVKVPSLDTRAMVISLLRERGTARHGI